MMFQFQSTDEMNDLLLKDTTPMEYCKKVIAFTVSQIKEYLDGEHSDVSFNALRFFGNRQCSIFMKNHTQMLWDIETPLAAVVLPEIDDIEYVQFDAVPLIMTKEEALAKGIDAKEYSRFFEYGVCDLGRCIGNEAFSECCFDSIHGAYRYGDEYEKAVHQNAFFQGNYTDLYRGWREWSTQLKITKKGYGGTYFACMTDGAVGALVAEQILMSNRPEDRSIAYGRRRYKPLAVYAPIPPESWYDIYDKRFMKTAAEYCYVLDSRLELSARGSFISGINRQKNTVIAQFIYLYVHSLLNESPASNFTIIEPIFTHYLQSQTEYRFLHVDELLPEIQKVCRTDYFKAPLFQVPKTPLEHFQAAVWAVTNSSFYLEAIQNILEFVNYQHSGKLAVILTGIFAGIYYQHYDIPKKYLTENRWYGRFSMSIVPLTHKVYERGEKHNITAKKTADT